jgi:hypothetical protein
VFAVTENSVIRALFEKNPQKWHSYKKSLISSFAASDWRAKLAFYSPFFRLFLLATL